MYLKLPTASCRRLKLVSLLNKSNLSSIGFDQVNKILCREANVFDVFTPFSTI